MGVNGLENRATCKRDGSIPLPSSMNKKVDELQTYKQTLKEDCCIICARRSGQAKEVKRKYNRRSRRSVRQLCREVEKNEERNKLYIP